MAYEEEFAFDEYEPTAPAAVPVNPKSTRLFESTWYSRVDYFYWGEQVDDAPFMENNGAMPTLGWQQRHGQQRYRAELFGGRVDYFADITVFPRANFTGQVELGYRGPRLFVGGFFEIMVWSRSPQVLGYDGQPFTAYQPDSQNVQVGLKSGLSY